MNSYFHLAELPLSQIVSLLADEPTTRQSVVFLPLSEAGAIGFGDFVVVESNTNAADNADNEYPTTLFHVTNVLQGEEGIAPDFVAVSILPVDSDDLWPCSECGGTGSTSETDEGHTRYYSCDGCGGVGKRVD